MARKWRSEEEEKESLKRSRKNLLLVVDHALVYQYKKSRTISVPVYLDQQVYHFAARPNAAKITQIMLQHDVVGVITSKRSTRLAQAVVSQVLGLSLTSVDVCGAEFFKTRRKSLACLEIGGKRLTTKDFRKIAIIDDEMYQDCHLSKVFRRSMSDLNLGISFGARTDSMKR